jgi:putative endonuclease
VNVDARKATGQGGEDHAARVLEADGHRIVERNVAFLGGEIDLVAMDGPTWVFVEVKARRNARYGDPLEGVTPAKQRRIAAAAARFLAERGIAEVPVRFDVIGIDLTGDAPRIEWVRGAFDAPADPVA